MQSLENLVGALRQKCFGRGDAQLFGSGTRAANLATQNALSVSFANQRTQIEIIALDLGEAGDRHLTATVQVRVDGTFCDHAVRSLLMMERLQQRDHVFVSDAALDANGALPTRGQ
jgi:hypothetical protein